MKTKKTIHIHIPAALKNTLNSIETRWEHLYESNNSVVPKVWESASEAESFKSADLHVVFIDSADWMSEGIVVALTKAMDENPLICPVKRMLLFGFMDRPDSGANTSTTINKKPMLKFLFQAFPLLYEQLPSSAEDIVLKIADTARNNDGEQWERDWKRVYCAIQRRLKPHDVPSRPLTRHDVWDSFENFADADVKAREEHDAGKGTDGRGYDITKIAAFQDEIDCFYLATARDCRKKRSFIFIEDNPEVVCEDLRMLACATGHTFFVTRKPNASKPADDKVRDCHDMVCYIESAEFNGKFREEDFECISDACTTITAASQSWIDPAAILVDLQLGNDGYREISGENVLHILQDKIPSVPTFVVTRSEEPDVFARCLRLSGADRVVPKRRLTRFPHAFTSYLYGEVSPLLRFFEHSNQHLAVRLTEAYRTWKSYPGILWHGEKTYHAAEHTLEHHLGLWKLANELLPCHWERIQAARKTWMKKTKQRPYAESDLFRFLMSLWLHDIGIKGNERYQMADQVRSRHSWISGDLIRRNPEIYLLTRGEESEVVALLCEYHQSCAPFENIDKCERAVTGLFQQSLLDIERNCGWPLMEWAALLRLLDAMEHNWRRVGIGHLAKAKQVAIQVDRRYYLENAAHDKDSEEYAEWLNIQQHHMNKHLSVVDMHIKTKLADDNRTVVFWPEYTFTNGDTARKFMPEIAWYVLKEWHSTGKYMSDRMGMRLANSCDGVSNSSGLKWAVWDFSDDKEYANKKEAYKSLQDEVKKHTSKLMEESTSLGDKAKLLNDIKDLERRMQEPWFAT